MESIYSELALFGRTYLCARTDNVFFLISEVSKGTVSLATKQKQLNNHNWCHYPGQTQPGDFTNSNLTVGKLTLVYLP